AQALSQQTGVVRLALGNDEMPSAQALIRLARCPGGIQCCPPALESSEDVQAIDDCCACVIHEVTWRFDTTPWRARGSGGARGLHDWRCSCVWRCRSSKRDGFSAAS